MKTKFEKAEEFAFHDDNYDSELTIFQEEAYLAGYDQAIKDCVAKLDILLGDDHYSVTEEIWKLAVEK